MDKERTSGGQIKDKGWRSGGKREDKENSSVDIERNKLWQFDGQTEKRTK